MAFMRATIDKGAYYLVETDNGIEPIAAEYYKGDEGREVTFYPVGYCAYLSADGYLDRTDGAVFKTVRDAALYLLEMYFDGDPDDWDDGERTDVEWLRSLL